MHTDARAAFIGAAALGWALLGCGAAGAEFSGQARSPVSEPEHVALVATVPPAFERIGDVVVTCENLKPGSSLDGARLADLACSPELLVAALQDRAAEVGGSLLAGLGCAVRRSTLECWGDVYTPAGGKRPAVVQVPVNVDPLATGALGAPPRGFVADAWRVRVDAWPRKAPAQSKEQKGEGAARRAPSAVQELAVPSMAELPIGDLRASCDSGCNSLSVREALRAAAAHIGASSVVGVRCVQAEAGTTCVASASLLEVPEDAPVTRVAGH